MSGFMIKFGGLLHKIISIIRGKDDIIYLSSPFQWFLPNWHWRNILELVLVLGIFIYQGWQLSRVKHIYITPYYLKFFIDNKMIDKIKTSDIEASFVINNSQPEVLIIGKNKVLTITNFEQEKLAKLFWAYLDEAINSYQKKQPKQLSNESSEEKE